MRRAATNLELMNVEPGLRIDVSVKAVWLVVGGSNLGIVSSPLAPAKKSRGRRPLRPLDRHLFASGPKIGRPTRGEGWVVNH